MTKYGSLSKMTFSHYLKHAVAASALSVLPLQSHATLADLAGSFGNQLEELAAASNQATYDLLAASGCSDQQRNASVSCSGAVFISWQTVRELVHTANALDQGSDGSGSTEFSLDLDLEDLGFALRWTAGEEFSAQGDMSNSFIGGQLSGLASRISALRHGGTRFAFNQHENTGILVAAKYLDGQTGGGASADDAYIKAWSPWGSFLNASYTYGSRSATTLEDAYDFDGVDLNGGVDYRFDNNQVFGVMLGYQSEELDFDSSQSVVDGGVDMTGFSIQPFYLYQSDNWYMSLSLGYQMMSFDMDRSIRYPSLNPNVPSTNTTAVSDTDATGLSSSSTFGYAFNLLRELSVEPYMSLDYRNVEVDSYSEKDLQNAGFAFVVSGQDVDSLETAYGLKFQYVLTPSFGVFVPYLDMQHRIQHKDDARNIEAFYLNASEAIGNIQNAAFSLPTDKPDSSYQIYTLGLSTVIQGAQLSGENTAASGGLQAFANIRFFKNLSHYTQTQIAGGLRYEF
jgi:hypothetical protein